MSDELESIIIRVGPGLVTPPQAYAERVDIPITPAIEVVVDDEHVIMGEKGIDQMLAELEQITAATAPVTGSRAPLASAAESTGGPAGHVLGSAEDVLLASATLKKMALACMFDMFGFGATRASSRTLQLITPHALYTRVNQTGHDEPSMSSAQVLRVSTTLANEVARLHRDVKRSRDHLPPHTSAQFKVWDAQRVDIIKTLRAAIKDNHKTTGSLAYMLLDSLLSVHEEEHRCHDELLLLGKSAVHRVQESQARTTRECGQLHTLSLAHMRGSCARILEEFHSNSLLIEQEKKATVNDSETCSQQQSMQQLWLECLAQMGDLANLSGDDLATLSIADQMQRVRERLESSISSSSSSSSSGDTSDTSGVGTLKSAREVRAQQRVEDALLTVRETEAEINQLLLERFQAPESSQVQPKTASRSMTLQWDAREKALETQLYDAKETYSDALEALQVVISKQIDTDKETTQHARSQQHQALTTWLQRVTKMQDVCAHNTKVASTFTESFVRLEYGLQEECRQTLLLIDSELPDALVASTSALLAHESAQLKTHIDPNHARQSRLRATLATLAASKEQYVKQLSVMDAPLTYSIFNLHSLENNLQKVRRSDILIFALATLSKYLFDVSAMTGKFYEECIVSDNGSAARV